MTEATQPEPAVDLPPAGGWTRNWCWAAALVIVTLHFAPDWFSRYEPGFDESFCLQAGKRLAAGEGLTFICDDRLTDLSAPDYQPMRTWPPLYSWLYALVLSTGWGTTVAGAVLTASKTLGALAGTYGWLRLANRVLPAPATGLFCLCLSAMFFGDSPFGNSWFTGPSHLYFWSILPWLIGHLLTAVRTGSLWHAAAVGGLAAIAIGFRYNAVYTVPAGVLGVMLMLNGSWMRRFAAATLIGLPPLLTVLGFFAVIRHISGGGSTWLLGELSPTLQWEHLSIRHPFTIFFAFGFGIEESIFRLKPSWREKARLVYFLPFYALMAAAAWLGWRRGRGSWSGERATFAAVVAMMTSLLALLLCWLSLRVPDGVGFMPIRELRYYSELLPALAIAWLMAFSAFPVSWPRTPAAWPTALLVATAAVVSTRFVWNQVRTSIDHVVERVPPGHVSDPPLEERIREYARTTPGPYRFFDTHDGVLRHFNWEDEVLVQHTPRLQDLPQIGSSKPTFMLLVVRWRWNSREHKAMEHYYASESYAVAEFFGLQPEGVYLDHVHLTVLYKGMVPAFKPGERPLPQVKPLPTPPTLP